MTTANLADTLGSAAIDDICMLAYIDYYPVACRCTLASVLILLVTLLLLLPLLLHSSCKVILYIMSEEATPAPPATGPDGRPLGPDGKPLPGPQQMQQVMAQRRMAQQQAQVDEVVGIMKSNVEKVLERDSKLSELDERADALQDGASQFEKQAGKLKNKFWLQNMKFIIMGGIVALIFLILLWFKISDSSRQPMNPYASTQAQHPSAMNQLPPPQPPPQSNAAPAGE